VETIQLQPLAVLFRLPLDGDMLRSMPSDEILIDINSLVAREGLCSRLLSATTGKREVERKVDSELATNNLIRANDNRSHRIACGISVCYGNDLVTGVGKVNVDGGHDFETVNDG